MINPMSMILPPSLQKGDSIAIVSTARKISREEILPAMEIISSYGYNPVPGSKLFSVDRQFAGSDEERAKDLQDAINDPKIKAIFFARGGYGTVRIVDGVDYSNLKSFPKWLCGYSDITVLHAHLFTHLNLVTCHSSMPVNFVTNTKPALDSLFDVLSGKGNFYEWESFEENRRGEAEGILTGGNLSILYSLLGSGSLPDFRGKILFLEDLDEYLYHVDRMMMALKRAGILKNLAGLVVGGMSDMRDNAVPFGRTATEIINDAVREYSYPVAFHAPVGHISDNRALRMGIKTKLAVRERTASLTN